MQDQYSRTQLLLGAEAMEKLHHCRVAVFGIGGVGGYTVEALARSGVGALDLIDDDKVCLTNLNRQIVATRKTVGQYKVDVAAERIHDIDPNIKVTTYKTFFTPETQDQFDFTQYDYVVDAIDTVTGKIALVVKAKEAGVPIICAMGAGNKMDPTRFEVTDIYKTSVCPLAKVMRTECRKRRIKHLKVVYSKEPVMTPIEDDSISCKDHCVCPPGTQRKCTIRRSVPGSNAFVPSEAAQAAKQVMESGVYQLFNDYRHFFSEDNKYNCEVIFDIEAKLPEYPTDYDQNIWRLNRPAPLKELVDTYLCVDGKTIEESPLYDPTRPYENRDPRLLKSIVCIGYPYLGKTITKEDVATTGFGVKKYTSYEDDVTIPLVERSAFNFILIRYAEVLLTYAEAQNEASGPDQSVYDAINQLRRRPDINMPEVPKGLTKDQMREVIRRERRIELTFEGLYYSDILRWKTAEKENNGMMHNYEGIEVVKRSFNPKRDYLWPIPYNQTVLNPNLEQNPNWD